MNAEVHSFPAAGVSLTELSPGTRLSLRLRPEGRGAAGAAFGLVLPTRVGGIAAGTVWRALCLGPDEWQIDGAAGAAIPAMPAGLPHALVDISDREVTWRIEGPQVTDLLAVGIARDVRRINPGAGCRTVFDGVQAVLVRESETAFTLSVWRSFAAHVGELLAIARRELDSGV
jgi:sarcosine oxidase subunit gamma